MTPDLDRIRTTHAVAIANRQRGSFDSRDDDIGALLGEVERLRPDAERWRYVREHGSEVLRRLAPPNHEMMWLALYGDAADAAVDAARKAT